MTPLTDAQRALVEEALEQWPGFPWALRVMRPVRRHRAGPHGDDIAQACLLALAVAARRFDPARGVPLVGFAGTAVYGAAIETLARAKAQGATDPTPVDAVAAPAAEAEPADDEVSAVRAAIAGLTPAERAVVEYRYGFGGDRPGGDAGFQARTGVTRQGMAVLEASAAAKLRAALSP